MRTVIQIVLGLAVIFLGYMVYESIMTPIRFNKAESVREKAAISRLIDIREAQKAFKDSKMHYTGSFDTLINFLKNDSILVTKAIGMIPESLIDSLQDIKKAREIALKRGWIRRETSKVAVLDSIFGKRQNFSVDSLRIVPFTNNLNFDMKAGEYVTKSSLTVKVLEVSVLYENLLKGLDPQLVVNYIDERMKITKFAGIKFGSFEEGTLSGNWE
jgi:hypothetical protein